MFKEKFIQLCSQKGVSPSTACRAVGLAPATFSCWTSESIPRQSTLLKIADYFNVSTAFLLGRPDYSMTSKNFYSFTGDLIEIPWLDHYDITDAEKQQRALVGAQPMFDTPSERGFFALTLQDNSIWAPDDTIIIVIAERQDDVENGTLAVVQIGNDLPTCRKIKKTPEGVLLLSTNPTFEPMFYSNQEVLELPLRVLGKVVELRAKY